MKFGVRECANMVFRAKTAQKIGNTLFQKGQPVLYIDTAKTSTLEGAATTVYAQGGRGNTRLIAWEGEKTLTFTVEDALLSPIGFSILSGAGLLRGTEKEEVHVHTTIRTVVDANGVIELEDALRADEKLCKDAPIFVILTEADGSLTGDIIEVTTDVEGKTLTAKEVETAKGKNVFVDCYVAKSSAKVSELQIDAENFGGYFYVEADTLFRDQATGADMPANITLPNVKIQSNFTFSLASTGDPSTFTFTMDAFPGYTYFDRTRQVLCVIQIIDDTAADSADLHSVMTHPAGFDIDESKDDSTKSDFSDLDVSADI